VPNLLESLTAELNRNIFYREFSFAKNEFVGVSPGQAKEFADHVVWIDDLLMVYQLKEREQIDAGDAEAERNWFKKKVLGDATRQVRDRLRFLQEHPVIDITNERGHTLNVNSARIKRIVKLVLYQPSPGLPQDCLATKHHVSRTAGVIHVLPWNNYLDMCRTLVTPAEVAEYFDFRQNILTKWPPPDVPSEVALVGQYLADAGEARPSEDYAELLRRLKDDLPEFDISFLLDGMADRIEYQFEGTGSEVDYYAIIAEFAKLNRLELKEVKKRLTLCLEAVREDRFMAPTRIISTATRCGFVFIPVESELLGDASPERRAKGLRNLTLISKYQQRLDRHVGVAIAKEGTDRLLDFCFVDFPWETDAAMEEVVRDQNLFRPLRSELRPRYEAR